MFGAGTAIAGFCWCVVSLIVLAVLGLCGWKIAEKAGYEPWMGLVAMFIPFVNIAAMVYFAFTEWPIEAEIRKNKGGGAG